MGFANSPVTRDILAGYGIRVTGYRWRWGLGLKGGTFPPHFHQNGEYANDAGDFEALPGEDVNGDYCTCNLVPQYRDSAGRFAKPGLQPVFQPPATAALQLIEPRPETDYTPIFENLRDMLATDRPLNVAVTIPDGAIVVNIPRQDTPTPQVTVNVPEQHTAAPVVNVAAPNVTVEAATVTVPAPVVNVEPRIEVKPAPVKIIQEKLTKTVRFRRNTNGLIESAEVTE